MVYFAKIFQQTFWQILGKVITSLSTFIILGLIARNYGESGTGIFTLALTYLAIFYLLSDFGFNAHVLKEIQNSKFKVQNEWQKLLATRLIWSGILAVLAVVLLPLWPFTTAVFSQAVVLGSLAIIFSGIFITSNLIFQSNLKYQLSVLSSSLGTIASLGIFILLTSQKLPVAFLMIAHLFGWLVISVLSLIFAKRFLENLRPIIDIKFINLLFKQTWPIAGTLFLNVLYFRADSFMIAYFKSLQDVGIYNVAYSVFQSALVLPTFIMNAYYPLRLL